MKQTEKPTAGKEGWEVFLEAKSVMPILKNKEWLGTQALGWNK